jgi:hypothetical protein
MSIRSFLIATIERKFEERENVKNRSRPIQIIGVLNKIIVEKTHNIF